MNSINGYQIGSLLAKGGMASIYLAVQNSLQRQVVLKILNPEMENNIRERFLNEGQIIAQLKHPNIVTVFDVGSDCIDNIEYNFLAMEYLEGGDLQSSTETGMDTYHVLEVIDRIADALQLVHEQGIIHADVKPANILFRSNGCPVLADFGISRRQSYHRANSHSDVLYTSPVYASPELIQALDYDQRTDIYSLGIVMYQLLTGKKPYKGESEIEMIANSIREPVPLLPDHLNALQPLLDGMLAKKPVNRIPQARQISQFIQQFIRENPAPDTTSHRKTKLIDTGNVVEYARQRDQADSRKNLFMLFTTVLLISVVILAWYFRDFSDQLRVNIIASIQAHSDISANDLPVEHTDSVNIAIDDLRDIEAHLLDESKNQTADIEAIRLKKEMQLKQQTVKVLLDKADDRLKKYRLTIPLNDNALFYYQQVLAMEPNNTLALEGIKKIVARYEFLARAELEKYKYQKSQQYINRGLSIDPDNIRLLELKQEAKLLYEPKRVFRKVSDFLQKI